MHILMLVVFGLIALAAFYFGASLLQRSGHDRRRRLHLGLACGRARQWCRRCPARRHSHPQRDRCVHPDFRNSGRGGVVSRLQIRAGPLGADRRARTSACLRDLRAHAAVLHHAGARARGRRGPHAVAACRVSIRLGFGLDQRCRFRSDPTFGLISAHPSRRPILQLEGRHGRAPSARRGAATIAPM